MNAIKPLDSGLSRTVYGDAEPSRQPWLDADPKFWSRVQIAGPDDCWRWTGPLNVDGYGHARGTGAHRHAYMLAHGEIPEGRYILHQCDNPACCNPAHLVAGTQRENMTQKFQRGRHTDFSRKLTRRDVIRMRRLADDGHGYSELADQFGVTHGHARNILNGHKWPGKRADDNQSQFNFGA